MNQLGIDEQEIYYFPDKKYNATKRNNGKDPFINNDTMCFYQECTKI